MRFYLLSILGFSVLLFLFGCSSSSTTRYGHEDKEEKEENTTEDITKEDTPLPPFDMTPYHSRFEFNMKDSDEFEGDIWYGYDTTSASGEAALVDKEGYRVEVLATDDLEQANNMRSELNFRIKQKVYIIFDPPFYRVRTGDYENRSAAENQSFKLKQLGYQESRVVSDSIKVTERP